MVLDGEAAPPMANGEIVFDEPWQSRAFGMARALCEQGLFSWDEFREQLIKQIDGDTGEGEYEYFGHFLRALTAILESKRVFSSDELDELSSQFAARPHGHDHSH